MFIGCFSPVRLHHVLDGPFFQNTLSLMHISIDHSSYVRLHHVLDGRPRLEGGTLWGPDAEGGGAGEEPEQVCGRDDDDDDDDDYDDDDDDDDDVDDDDEQVHPREPAEAAAAGLAQPGTREAQTEGRKTDSVFNLFLSLLCFYVFVASRRGRRG